jgi:hypothetical protein
MSGTQKNLSKTPALAKKQIPEETHQKFVCGGPFRGSDQSSIFAVLAPVAGDAVQQDESGIDLELVQIKSPCFS